MDRVAPPAPVMTPSLLPSGSIGNPMVNMEKPTQPGQRLPHFNTGMSEGTGGALSAKAPPGPLSNGALAGKVSSPLSQEVKPIMDVAAV